VAVGGAKLVWGGHSCPPQLRLLLKLGCGAQQCQNQPQLQRRRTRVSVPHEPKWELNRLFRLREMAVGNFVNMEELHERVYPLRSMDNIKFQVVSHLPFRIAII
jgi:hypothetical protein